MLLFSYMRFVAHCNTQILVVTLVINLHDDLLVNFTVYRAVYLLLRQLCLEILSLFMETFRGFCKQELFHRCLCLGITNRRREKRPHTVTKGS